MNRSFTQKLRLFVIRLALEIIIFIDFLEDLPKRAVRITLYFAVFTVLIVFLVVGFIVESTSHPFYYALSRLVNPIFIAHDLDLSYRYPILKKTVPFPQISARSILIADSTRNKLLYESNANTPLPPASTTKLMTALVSRDIYKLDEIVSVPKTCTDIDTSRLGFLESERLVVADLIHALLISSSGDAACALAFGKVTQSEFIKLMNEKAVTLGLNSTFFSNPIGLDDLSSKHLSSARDLLVLTKAVQADAYLKQIVQTKEYTVASGSVNRKIFNTNDLLWDVPGTVGVKTGRTYGAGEVLIYEYHQNGIDIVIIVMGSLDRFKDTVALLEWTLESYDFGI